MKSKEQHSVKFAEESSRQPSNSHNQSENKPKHKYVLIYASIVSVFISELALSLFLYSYIQNVSDFKDNNFRKEIDEIIYDNLKQTRFRDEIGVVFKDLFDDVERDLCAHYYESNTKDSELNRPVNIKPLTSERHKRDALVLDDNTVTQGGVDEGHVEFFDPNLRHELEAKDELERTRNGHGADSWVWVNSYSRIPSKAMEGFCRKIRDYCPPGKPGPQGEHGLPGLPGTPGMPGDTGPVGPKGTKGEIGWPGSPGLDGRDGVPGEPGLDGIPGRSGSDGIPGKDGIPGRDGSHGRHGFNGTDGKPGLTGPQGPPGPQGIRGMSGPRGRTGKPGTNGTPGIPGINAWKVRVNGSNELLIPPSIAVGPNQVPLRPIIVHEGENLRLRCAVTGIPRPNVEWRRTDNQVIPMGSWQSTSIPGHTLNITHISRAHMGGYTCVADNGVPPVANQTFFLEVHFAPLITIRNQMIGAANLTTAVLECEVEAFPEPIRYWERSDGRLLEHGEKYRIETINSVGAYKSIMRLNITRISYRDFSDYHCISKNEMGITRGVFTLYEIDPRLATPPPLKTDASGVAVYGERPPISKSLEELCPQTTPQCPECLDPKDFKCKDSGLSLLDLVEHLDIRPLFNNATYPGLPNRTLDCVLYAVGKPVYHRFTEQSYGSWMRDSAPKNEASGEKIWVTREMDHHHLFEYNNKTVFRKEMPSRVYNLDLPFRGNAHVVYNGSFYYNERNRARILRFDLVSERYAGSLEVPLVATNGSNYLYTTEYNYMDFSVDDNGLWIIYGLPTNNNTVVVKLDTNTMREQYAWNISVNHHKVGEMFVVCGVLYAVDSVTDRTTKIRLALDLYRNLPLEVSLSFTNPFRKTTMVGYNHRHKELYTWDKGNQLTYPVRYHEIGYNMTGYEQRVEPRDGMNAKLQTDFLVYP